MVKHVTSQDALESFYQAVVKASQTGRWLGVVFSVDKEGRMTTFRTTSEFPTDRFGDSVLALAYDLQGERLQWANVATSPLPIAPEFMRGVGEMQKPGMRFPCEEPGSQHAAKQVRGVEKAVAETLGKMLPGVRDSSLKDGPGGEN